MKQLPSPACTELFVPADPHIGADIAGLFEQTFQHAKILPYRLHSNITQVNKTISFVFALN